VTRPAPARSAWSTLPALTAVSLVAACCTPSRDNPLPEDLAEVATIPGIPLARSWGDAVPREIGRWMDKSKSELIERFSGIYGREHNYLSISGGGADGAFGAGLLCGWTEEGTRPEFTLVSGISTGSLIAPFAFLGSEYDDQLRELYTTLGTKDLAKSKSIWRIMCGDSVMDTSPMRKSLRKYYTQDVLDAIAVETRRGRSLLIGTTNLDAGRPVIWNIGRIAESDAPNKLELFQDILLASAAIPGAFPPVLFEVEAEGERYDELHVDGGATTQLFLYPVGLDWAEVLDLLQVPGKPTVYMIRNSKLSAPYRVVPPRVLHISAITVASLMRVSGFGDLYRMYVATQRDGLAFRLAALPEDFDAESNEVFDSAYMQELFARGHQMALEGYPWEPAPPGVVVDDDAQE